MNLTFVLTSYKDADLAVTTIAALGKLYPKASIIHLSDLPPKMLRSMENVFCLFSITSSPDEQTSLCSYPPFACLPTG